MESNDQNDKKERGPVTNSNQMNEQTSEIEMVHRDSSEKKSEQDLSIDGERSEDGETDTKTLHDGEKCQGENNSESFLQTMIIHDVDEVDQKILRHNEEESTDDNTKDSTELKKGEKLSGHDERDFETLDSSTGIDIKHSNETCREIGKEYREVGSFKVLENDKVKEMDSSEKLNTMIIHDTQLRRKHESSPFEMKSSSSKNLASDEVLSSESIAVKGANSEKIILENSATIEKQDDCKIIQPCNDNKNTKSDQNMNDQRGTFYNSSTKVRDIEEFISNNTLDDTEEYGAVGGRDKHHQINDPKSSKDNFSGILHRKGSLGRKSSSSVQFDDSVSVEVFCQTEPATDCSTKVVLAQGDGPDPNQGPPGMYGPFTEQTSTARLNDIQEIGENSNTQSQIDEPRQETNSESRENLRRDSPHKIPFQRKDSTPRVLSPTQLLRQKQKNVTDKIIQSISKNSVSSAKSQSTTGQILVAVPNDADEDNYQTVTDNTTTANQKLLRVNSSDFVDPSFLKDLPDALASHVYPPNEETEHSGRKVQRQISVNSASQPYRSKENDVGADSKQRNKTEKSPSATNPTKLRQIDVLTNDDNQLGSFSYTSPSKLLKKMNDRDKGEKSNQGTYSLSYTTPSELLDKTCKKEKVEKSSNRIGTLSYTTPSVLLQKLNDRDIDDSRNGNKEFTDSYSGLNDSLPIDSQTFAQDKQYPKGPINNFKTKPIRDKSSMEDQRKDDMNSAESEHQNKSKSIQRGDPGYWFFKSSNSSFTSDVSCENAPDLDSGWSSDKLSGTSVESMVNSKSKVDKFRERCRKKKRLDDIRTWTLEHSHSSALMLHRDTESNENHLEIDNKTKSNVSESTPNIAQQDPSFEQNEHSFNRIHSSGIEINRNTGEDIEDNNSEDDILHSPEAQGAIDYMNLLLIDFLNLMNWKQERGMPITVDDYRELESIHAIITCIGNRLNDLAVHSEDSLSHNESKYESVQEGGSSQIHIDLHDRNLIERMMTRLRTSLSDTGERIQSWSDPSLNSHFENNETENTLPRYSKSTNEKYISSDNENICFGKEDENLADSGYQEHELPRKNYENCHDEKEMITKSYEMNSFPPCDTVCSGYLGDRSGSESSMPDLTESEYKRKIQWGQSGGTLSANFDEQLQNQEQFNDNKYISTCTADALLQTDSSRSFSSGNYIGVDSDWSLPKENVRMKSTTQVGYRLPPYNQQPPGFQWSRVSTGTTMHDDFIYENGLIDSCDKESRPLSTDPQIGSQSDMEDFSNIQLTSNPSFKAQSSSEYENDDNDDDANFNDDSFAKRNTYVVKSHDTSNSPGRIKWLTCVSIPDDLEGLNMDLGPTSLTVRRQYNQYDELKTQDFHEVKKEYFIQEGSPDRGQRLYGSSQNLDRRGDAGVSKRKQAGARSMTPDSRSFMMEREVNESQNRKFQMEISTLQTENKLLKEKNNRSQARISELETQLAEAQEDLNALQDNLDQEVSDLSTRTKQEIERGRDEMQTKILVLTKENEALKAEVSSLEKRLESSHRATDMARHNSEKARTIDAYKVELSTMKEELNRVKALLDQSEKHLREEEERHTDTSKQVLKLTELKNALQQQSDAGGSGAILDKQMKSLEKRLKVTEERLHQERSDRAINLSAVEDKLLTENSKLQASEKDLKRQLQREKEKNRNHDHRVKQLREENEKLRIALPFDDSVLTSDKQKYDIPYGSHSSQRAETMKNVSDDMNYILSQIEKQDGLSSGQEEKIICTLWNKRELAYKHLREYELQIEELQLHDNNNIVDGLKNLRDTYSQSESKLKNMEEKMEDMQALMSTTEATYKEQLTGLVQERHDAFARLKTAEDLLEAVRTENEMLRKNVSLIEGGVTGHGHLPSGENFEALKQEIVTLEGKVAQLKRNNEKLEGELTTAKVQLDARNKALQDTQSELDLAYNRLQGEEVDDRKQIKIDKLTAQVNTCQIELKSWTDKYNHLVTEKSKIETELSLLKKSTSPPRGRQQKLEQIDSKVLQQMKDDIIEKESRLVSVNKQLEDTENELQKVRQELYVEQMHTSELEDEMDTLQHTATQRAQMFEALSGTEREQLAQYQILKETLDSVNQELAQKQAQIISLDVNLSGQRDKTVELEHEVERLRRERQDTDEVYSEDEQNSAHQLRIKVLEQERAQLKQELTQAYSAIQAAEEQYRTLQTESSQIEQELVKEKTIILQITAEKGEVEQHLEELAEEHDALIQEKNQVEEDLIKLENKLQEILQKYEAEAKKQHSDFTKQYPTLPPEGRKLVSELDSLRLVVDGKNREIEMLKDKLSRCNIEIDFLNRKVELVHNDSISNREDVARMISELTLKMKEAVSTREVNQYLVEERTKLQNEKSHLERELEQERRTNDERKKEIADVIRKIERTETHKKTAEKDSKNKEGTIATLETELRNSKHSLDVMETENSQLKNKLDHLNHDLKNLTTINESLEKRLDLEKGALTEERTGLSKLKEEHNSLVHEFQILQHNHKVLSEKYETELGNVEKLKHDLNDVMRANSEMKEELHTAKLDFESQKGELSITKESVQKLTQDKGSIYQDYESMCRTLTEKERQLNELKTRSEEKLELVKREHAQEKLRLDEHKTTAEKECEAAKREMESLEEQLKQKEVQLSTFGKTLQELETVTREKRSLESQIGMLESTTGDSKLLLEGQRKEIMSLNEALAKQQERTIRFESECSGLNTELKSLKESSNREVHELKLTINELKSQHENERHYLNDNLAQTQNRLRSVETSLASALKEQDELQSQRRIKEKEVEDLQAQLTDESTGRRLAEHSVGSLRLQLEDTKNTKNVAEAKFNEMQTQLNKAESQHKTEQDRNQKLLGKVQELQAVSHTTESNVKAKSEQVDTLQKEINKLKQLLDSQKQSHIGKMKKSALEFRQQLDLSQEEKDKLVLQVQQIAADLDACREQIANKNKENLKLQEECLMMEDSLRESKTKQKQAEETLKVEMDKQTQLSSRFREQDEELKRLRNFLAKKVEESGDADKSMWHEMNRVIQELSKQMQNHLDAQKSGSNKEGEGHSVVRYKKQITELQSELNTEKSLHQITKTSLQALEEDCQRLRQQLQTWRRREPHSSENPQIKPQANTSGKYKNRMEAINAIIARSQSQAQALLATGGYLGNTIHSPRTQHMQGYGSPRHNDSPDNSFSEDLSIASLPPLHYGSPTKHP